MPVVGLPTNRTSVDLPVEVSREILQKAQEGSAIMRLARQIQLPGRGVAIPVITSDVEADWVTETGKKPTSNPGLSTKTLRGYKLAVIVPFSEEFERDANGLYQTLIDRIAPALAQKFDATVFGASSGAPGSDFDTLGGATAQAIGGTLTYNGLVAADTDISTHGGIMNGIVLAPQGKGVLLGAKDNDGRPLFINNVSEGAVPMVLGAKTDLSKGAYKAGTGTNPNQIGIAGDWTQAVWGAVEGVRIKRAEEATLTDGEGNVISLFERDMIAIRAEIEIGFRADVNCFNVLTDATSI